jgi:DNA repair protein RadA/Sms
LAERPVPADLVLFGELALSGEIRPVAHAPLRLRESAKLGFERAYVPSAVADGVKGIAVSGYRALSQLVDQMLGRG